MQTPTRKILALLCGTALSAASGATWAQGAAGAFPSKPISIIVPVAAGGGQDIEVRFYADRLARNTNWKVLVDAKPGAGSTIGTGFVAKAVPDGHTLLSTTSTFTVAPTLYQDLPYNPQKDIAPVVLMSKRASMLVVHPSVPVRTVQEYIAYTRANPGKLNFGSSGRGNITHLAAEWMHVEMKSKATFVYYKGGAPLYVDLVAGRVDATMSSPLSMVPYIKAGKLRAIGMTSSERVALFPDLPTVAEGGAPGFEYSYWVGFTTTGGTPAAAINRLNAEFVKVARMPEVVQKLAEDAVQPIGSTPEQFRQHIDSEMKLWTRLTKELGIKMEE